MTAANDVLLAVRANNTRLQVTGVRYPGFYLVRIEGPGFPRAVIVTPGVGSSADTVTEVADNLRTVRRDACSEHPYSMSYANRYA